MDTEQKQNEDTYAGFWARFSAVMLDNAIIAFLTVHIYWALRDQLTEYFEVHPDVMKMLQGGGDISSLDSYHLVERFMYYYIMVFSILFAWLYFAGFESSYLKATPGKKIMGLYVTDLDGGRVSFGQATGRYFGKFISGLILAVGYLMAGFTEKKQALHDVMAGCLVWKK